jgi:hypothetical protein
MLSGMAAACTCSRPARPSRPDIPVRLYRFGYSPATKSYTLDPGFPVQLNDTSTEALVIDKDSPDRRRLEQPDDAALYFAFHVDGASNAEWTASTATRSPLIADDHINLKSLGSDASGRIFAVIKTSLDSNDSTSTKQNLTRDSDLVVVASNDPSLDYWHNLMTLPY